MKKMKKILCFLLVFAMTFGCMSGMAFAATGTRPADGTTWDQPFESGTGGSDKFRIPCLVALDDGTIVAGCDARWTTYMDGGGLDTIISYSKDNGDTWRYTFANYLGDNGNVHNNGSTAFIDPAMATDGKTIWLIADLYPAGVALNGAAYGPQTGHRGYDKNGNLALAAANDSVNGSANSYSRAQADYDYHLEKIDGAADDAESYYLLKNTEGNTVEGYTIDAFFNIKGDGVDTNLFCADSPYFPYPTDFLYMTSSTDGGATWSIPTLLDVKEADEATLLVGPGRGMVTSEGRIVFTAYEYTNGDKFSCAIYSDDNGKTWSRGEDVSGLSSEAVVTEADGKLYMFTRHGNCYYVSDDWGETWGDPVSVPKPYISTCQLTAITYSEKIDGKTAILFVAPSNTGARAAGKIYVGLVQEDTTIDWAYEYSINGDAYYAYSCIAELTDGSIGLLYENAATEITYINIPIEDIVAGAKIGTVWLEDNTDNPVYSAELRPEDSTTLNIKGLAEGAAVEASSADENVATAVVNEDGTVTVTASSAVTGYAETLITVKSGDAETVLKVYVAASENYEVVELRQGETATYVDETGNYADTDTSSLDTDVATVTITDMSESKTGDGEQEEAELQAQLATAVGTFNGVNVNISDCLYTFTKADGDNNYIISNETAAGQTVFLNHRTSESRANTTTSTVITVAKQSSDARFTLLDNTTSSNGGYLFFHKSGNLHFDRNSSVVENCWFELFEKSETAPADSAIPGYVAVDAVEDGGEYLVASKASDGAYYVLYPFVSDNKWEHVAKVVEPDPTEETTIVIKAVGEGETSVTVGDVAYYIFVKSKELDITLKVGESFQKAGTISKIEDGQNIVSIEDVAEMAPYKAVAAIESGNKYLIVNRGAAMINSTVGENSLGMASVDLASGLYPDYMWTLTEVNDGYAIQDVYGEYVNFSGDRVTLSEEAPATLTIGKWENGGGYGIYNGSHYLNNWAGSCTQVKGYTKDDCPWNFYEPSSGVKITGTNVGTATVTVDNIKYNITVYLAPADYTAVDAALKNVPADFSIYTDETAQAVRDAVAAVVRGYDETMQSKVDEMAQAITTAITNLKLKATESPEVPEKEEVVRLSGKDRYVTGYKVADAYKKELGVDKFDAVIVATGINFADALSGSYLAAVKNAPILLTNGKEDNVAALHEYIKANVKANGTVYILGGTAAVPEAVESIKAGGYQVKRLYGKSRYDTNIAILEEAGRTGNELVVATGKNFADSLSASALKKPILLVKDEITDAQRAILRQYDGGKIYIIGGTGAVSEEIEAVVVRHGRTKRISGATRYETSVAVADTFFKEVKEAVVANGKKFPDGLCGGPLAAAMNAPLILTADKNTDAAEAYVAGKEIKSGYVLGGTGALVDDSVVAVFGLKDAAEIIVPEAK